MIRPRNGPDHDDYVREMWTKWEWPGEPAPCDCGYYGDGGLTFCHPRERAACHVNVQERLARHWRDHAKRVVRLRRAFPGPPHDGAKRGLCRWCGEDILREDDPSRLDLRRRWHPRCFHVYELHTIRDVQVAHLLRRDGPRCRACGGIGGKWERPRYLAAEADPADLRARDAWWSKLLPPAVFVAVYCPVDWQCTMEVDHVVALGLVAHLTDEERRPFFGPDNLQLLCVPCHQAKTLEDRAAIRAVRVDNPLPPAIPFASEAT